MVKEVFDIKGEMTPLSVLQLYSASLDEVVEGLRRKRDSSPQFFLHSPLVVDCSQLGSKCCDIDLGRLRESILELGFIPVGIRNLDEAELEKAVKAGWAILRAGRSNAPQPVVEQTVKKQQPEKIKSVEVVNRPVRSGQQIYFPDGDIVVLQHTSAGSELLAGGSVHVYGSLRGRVLAGVQGDTSARIFCQKLEAELVAIAGRYRLLDEEEGPEADLKGQPVMVWLDGEKLKIEPLV